MSERSGTSELLVLSDIHLRSTGETVDVAALSVEEYDLVVSLGDVIDDNRDHARSAESGLSYERRGRAFFEALNRTGTPVIAIPGNHDPLDCTRRLTADLNQVHTLHHDARDGAELTTASGLEHLSIFGWGCEQFDFTPALPAPSYPDLRGTEVEQGNRADVVAERIERATGRYLAGIDTRADLRERLGVGDQEIECFERRVDNLERRFETLVERMPSGTDSLLVAAHVTPFNVPFDRRGKHDRDSGPHFGSLALKLAILEVGPIGVLSGHMHQRGLTALETTNGHAYTHCPGGAGATRLVVDASGRFQTEQVQLPMV